MSCGEMTLELVIMLEASWLFLIRRIYFQIHPHWMRDVHTRKCTIRVELRKLFVSMQGLNARIAQGWKWEKVKQK